MRKKTAKIRGDGEKTRESLIEVAGELAAERGWSNVTAKDVCDVAGVNCASVNYWFGGRAELYLAVLLRIPETIFSQELEIEMVQYESTEEALRYFFMHHLQHIDDRKSWPMRVWAREVTPTPSQNRLRLVSEFGMPRIRALHRFFADFLGLSDCSDTRVSAAFISSMGPVLLLWLVTPEYRNIVVPGFKTDPESMRQLLIDRIMLGLKAQREAIQTEKA